MQLNLRTFGEVDVEGLYVVGGDVMRLDRRMFDGISGAAIESAIGLLEQPSAAAGIEPASRKRPSAR